MIALSFTDCLLAACGVFSMSSVVLRFRVTDLCVHMCIGSIPTETWIKVIAIYNSIPVAETICHGLVSLVHSTCVLFPMQYR